MLKQAVFDAEWNGDEASKIWCVVILDVETDEIFRYGPEEIGQGIEKLHSYDRIIGHNIIGADIPILNRLHQFVPKGQVMDTLILSRLSNPDRIMPWGMGGQWRPHGIDAWSVRLGGPRKVEHEDWSQFSPEMMHRCETDVRINLEVYKALWKEFKE